MLTLYETERLPQLKCKELLAESEYRCRYKREMKQKRAQTSVPCDSASTQSRYEYETLDHSI